MLSEYLSHSVIGALRVIMLATGWPILIVGTAIFIVQGMRFWKETRGTVFGKLVFPTTLGWVVTMYILGLTATFYMIDEPERGTLVVLPIFIIWLVTFIMLSMIIRRWSHEAVKIKDFYSELERKIHERTQELAQANKLLEEQVKELDEASRLLVTRDDQLQKANESLRKLDQAKTQFVSVAAHQLRTPLSVTKWTFEMLLSGDFGPLIQDQADVLRRGNEMNEQMIDLVSDLLDVARIESGQLDYVFTAIDLADFLGDIKNLYDQKASEKNITFTMHLPSKGSVLVRADEVRLWMLFQNLLDNAFKFTPSAGSIILSFEPKGEMAEFTIADTGIGISQEELPRLFTKFFRGRNAVAMETRGTGLGLYIAASIVHTHGGEIRVESGIGKGTTLTFTIPLAKARGD